MRKSAIVSYVPAIHAGYLKLFDAHPDADIFVLGLDLVHELPRLERDIRAIDPKKITALLGTLYSRPVKVLHKTDTDILKAYASIFLPDEDVSKAFVSAHISDAKKVTFESHFLRWDKQITTTEFQISPDRKISLDEADRELMLLADKEAQKSPDWWRQVGAVLVNKKQIVIKAHNRPYPTEHNTFETFGDPRSNFDAGQHIEASKALHAEAGIIAIAARQGIALEGCTLYVTTFPCPVCAKSVSASGIKKVYYRDGYSVLDAEDILKAADVEIILVK